MSDLDIIAQIERQIGKKLEKLDEVEYNSVGYQLNAQQQVISVGLYECELKELPKEISCPNGLRWNEIKTKRGI